MEFKPRKQQKNQQNQILVLLAVQIKLIHAPTSQAKQDNKDFLKFIFRN